MWRFAEVYLPLNLWVIILRNAVVFGFIPEELCNFISVGHRATLFNVVLFNLTPICTLPVIIFVTIYRNKLTLHRNQEILLSIQTIKVDR